MQRNTPDLEPMPLYNILDGVNVLTDKADAEGVKGNSDSIANVILEEGVALKRQSKKQLVGLVIELFN